MGTRLRHLLEILSANFWVLPLLFMLCAVVLAVMNYELDKQLFNNGGEIPQLLSYFSNSRHIRSFLSVTANSMIGVAGVSFSITIASLTLASQQFGPRLLRNFMRDRFNQAVLGLFSATFLYCVLILQFTSSMDLEKITPLLSVSTAMALVVADLFMLIFFIHHIAVAIQADSVIADVNNELNNHMLRFFGDHEKVEDCPIEVDYEKDYAKLADEGKHILARRSGYLQAVDIIGIRELSQKRDLTIQLDFRPGQYVINQCTIGRYLQHSGEEDDEVIMDEIQVLLLIGDWRSAEQDPEFSIRQLVEIAVRALSPGINDPFTAITCIDRLADNLAFLSGRHLPADRFVDDSGVLRVQLKPLTFAGIVEASFNQIRQHGQGDIAIVIRLLEVLKELSVLVCTQVQADALMTQVNALHASCIESVHADMDKESIEHLYSDILAVHQSFIETRNSHVPNES